MSMREQEFAEFEHLVRGEWREDAVDIFYDETLGREPSPTVDLAIDRAWEVARREAEAGGRLFFAGRLCRVQSFEPAGPRLVIQCGATDYREYLGTNRHLGELGIPLPELDRYLSNPLTVSAALRTSDGRILLGRRSHRTMEYAGYWHVIGGHIEGDRHVADRRVLPFQAMRDELREEAGVQASELTDLVCLGIVRPRDFRKMEMLFSARTTLTYDAVAARASDEEHSALLSIEDSPSAVARFLEEYAGRVVPTGEACLRAAAAL